jgi:CRP-like cAMP-binding protein
MRIIKLFSKQLRFLNETLAGLILKKTVIASPSHLFQVAEYYFKHNLYCQAFYSYTKYIKYCPNEDKTSAAKERLTKIEGFVKNKIPEFGTEVTRIYPKSNMLFAEGEPGDELFIIQKGIVKVSKIVDDNEMILAMLEAGDIFGEMALMENKPRLANAVAFEDCTVMVVNKTNFEYFSASHPQLIYRVTAILSERIWLVNKKLSNTLIINPLCHMYEALLVQLEKNRIPFTTKTPYTFNFGFPELCNMVGVSERDSRILIEKMLKNEIVRKTGNKIIAASVIELVMEAESYRKMEAIEKNKQGYEW